MEGAMMSDVGGCVCECVWVCVFGWVCVCVSLLVFCVSVCVCVWHRAANVRMRDQQYHK